MTDRALIYLAVDSGMRWSELVGLRQVKVRCQLPLDSSLRHPDEPRSDSLSCTVVELRRR